MYNINENIKKVMSQQPYRSHTKNLEKVEQYKPKASRQKEIIKIRAETLQRSLGDHVIRMQGLE